MIKKVLKLILFIPALFAIMYLLYALLVIIVVFRDMNPPIDNSKMFSWMDTYVKKNCENKNSCILSLKDITSFEWDKFYVVKVFDIDKLLGFKYPGKRDMCDSYVFLKDGKIIYNEDYFDHPERSPRFWIIVTKDIMYLLQMKLFFI